MCHHVYHIYNVSTMIYQNVQGVPPEVCAHGGEPGRRLGLPRVRSRHGRREFGHKVRQCQSFCHICNATERMEIMMIRSRAMRLLSLEQLCTLLKHALAR